MTAVTTSNHPLTSEMLAAVHQPETAAATLEHLEECYACAVRFGRLQEAPDPVVPSDGSLQRILEASGPLAENLLELVTAGRGEEPQAGEIWRAGRDEAILVWVRQVFSDGVADVVPLVFDVELADRESVIIEAGSTALGFELAAMVALRTHVHLGAFLNRVDTLDIRKDVSEVMTAVREGRRPSGVRVGPPIEDDDDQRLEYRQALRDVLAELTPSAWLASIEEDRRPDEDPAGQGRHEDRFSEQVESVKQRLSERQHDLRCWDVERFSTAIGDFQVTNALKITWLDTTVLVVFLDNAPLSEFPDAGDMAKACTTLTAHEPDVDTVAIAIPHSGWPTQLFTSAHMRQALELPGGATTGPRPTLDDIELIDALCKHFEGAMESWEVTEPVERRIEGVDYRDIALAHARGAVVRVAGEGDRARQSAKKAASRNLPGDFDERVANFVTAVVNGETVDQAMAELALEVADD